MRSLVLAAAILASSPAAKAQHPTQTRAEQFPTTKVLYLKIHGRGRTVYKGKYRVAGTGGSWLTADILETVSCRDTPQPRIAGAETLFRLHIGSNTIVSDQIDLALTSAPAPDYEASESSCTTASYQNHAIEKTILLGVGRRISFLLDDYRFILRRLQ